MATQAPSVESVKTKAQDIVVVSAADRAMGASMIASGIGSLVLGIAIVLTEVNAGIKSFLTWNSGISNLGIFPCLLSFSSKRMPPLPWGWNTRSSRTVSRSAWLTVWRKPAGGFQRSPFDLVLLDLGLPDGSGFELCKEIRAAGDTPVIILSARDEEASIALGLDLDADDYLTRPFRLRELISRMKAVLRRRGPVEASDRTLTCGDVTVVAQQARVYKNGREVLLTALEYRLLLAAPLFPRIEPAGARL